MNKCIFTGNVANDLQLVTRGTGQNTFSVLNVQISVKKDLSQAQRAAKKNGQQVKSYEYIYCEAVGKTADTIAQWFSKGKAISVECSFETYEKVDPQGQKSYGYKFKIHSFDFPPTDFASQGTTPGAQQPANNQYQVPANQMPYQQPAAAPAIPQFML